jgi:hypothetical protein
MKSSRKAIAVAIASVLLVLGGGTAIANAATVHTYISDWGSGSVGTYRTSTGADQEINLGTSCTSSTPPPVVNETPSSVQMQLQRYNGLLPDISEGNMTHACGTTNNWGVLVSGAQYRYQYNGSTMPGIGYGGWLFSAPSVTITY